MDLLETLESKAAWTIDELAELLQVSDKVLYKQASRGKIPAFKIGTCVRVYGKAFADYLRNKMK